MKDHYVIKVAEGAKHDPDYCYILQAIRERTEPRYLREDSEAKQMEGELKYLRIAETEGGEIITRNNTEVVIPKNFREEILTMLHAGHRAEAAMLQQSRGRFWWSGMREAIRTKYKSCEDCLLHAPSKPDP